MKKILIVYLGIIFGITKPVFNQNNWIEQEIGTNKIYDIYFLDIDTGWAAGDSGILIQTFKCLLKRNLPFLSYSNLKY